MLADGAKVLDVATGNGPVALSCAQRARANRKRLHIDAVDAAGISPPNQLPYSDGHLPTVKFQGGIWLEELPFQNDEFDGVMSQYGFEYADEQQAVAEVSRVLAPGGRLRLVIHARDGAVWKDIGDRNRRLNAVMADDGAVNLVRTLVQAQQKGDAKLFESKLKHLSSAVKDAEKLAVDAPPDDSAVFYSREFLYVFMNRQQYKISELLQSLEDGWKHAVGTSSRYEQMLQVAKSAEEMSGLCENLKAAGLAIAAVRQICDPANGAQIAWQLDAVKPSSAG
ncbi:MAG: methyltransferase domain-containing protein [Xanthomonadales bacterium]|nr:methyltransferase domain-containing protein [Gammaproteobacteria bacterium]MBT8052335.1 methyltransferase domain-containing protein [Gammaproteobacteria bacterium]NND56555.1 methyltransferase domain-containing protein [Xanthomonadales bacterium]NNK52546.1 methyltransferase domain-containing protein [Xanthomonadales bacterium]